MRRLIFARWRRYQLSHRQTALLWASVTPLILVVLFVSRGVDTVDGVLLLGGLVALTFGSTFVFAEYFFRAIGGEMDPPSSSGYRRRP